MKHVSHRSPALYSRWIGPDARTGEIHHHPVCGPVVAVDDHVGQLTPAGFDCVDIEHLVGDRGAHRGDVAGALTLVEALRRPVPAMYLEYTSIGPRRPVKRDLHPCPVTPPVELVRVVADN